MDIQLNETILGIELGSTRIKAVLINRQHEPIASAGFEWDNQLIDGYWTYALSDVWHGLQVCYERLAEEVKSVHGLELTTVGAIGISAMMHGYLVFDKDGRQLVPFRTWRNTSTEQAAMQLSELFSFNIPQRWSVAHLYQAALNNEAHVNDVAFITTLAGYVHWQLTGEKVIGIDDASGMFPIDNLDYNAVMLQQFDMAAGLDYKLSDILPKALAAGEPAGILTSAGAKLLDISGTLKPGSVFCPPEGDAGTGMTATNSIAVKTGNISAGTSIFAMVVLEKPLTQMYQEIDIVTTPAGKPVAMVHCNNFTSDIDAWVKLFREVMASFGLEPEPNAVYKILYEKSLEGEASAGGLTAYNYYGGEPITGLEEGRPLFVRLPSAKLNLPNFMRALIFSAMGTLKLGMNILTEKEHVRLDQLMGHGGFFKTKEVGQSLMASALRAPVTVMESAGEGGAWGIALLAAYMAWRAGESLEQYLTCKVFGNNKGVTIAPNAQDAEGFDLFMKRFTAGLKIEKASVEAI